MRKPKKETQPTKENLGDLLVKSLAELRDGVRGHPGKLTMKTVEIPDPSHFDAKRSISFAIGLG